MQIKIETVDSWLYRPVMIMSVIKCCCSGGWWQSNSSSQSFLIIVCFSYVPWNLHEPIANQFNFSEMLDLRYDMLSASMLSALNACQQVFLPIIEHSFYNSSLFICAWISVTCIAQDVYNSEMLFSPFESHALHSNRSSTLLTTLVIY